MEDHFIKHHPGDNAMGLVGPCASMAMCPGVSYGIGNGAKWHGMRRFAHRHRGNHWRPPQIESFLCDWRHFERDSAVPGGDGWDCPCLN